MAKKRFYNGYFTKIPVNFIRTKELDKKLLLTIISIDRNRCYEGSSSISIERLITLSGYSADPSNAKVCSSFKNQIQFLIDNEMISLDQNLKKYKIKEYIPIKVLDNFEPANNFTVITAREIDRLLQSPAKIDKSKFFAVYLYIKSFMRNRNIGDDGGEFKDAKDKPSAFWGAINSIVTDTGISKETINKCLKEYLRLSLFKRHVVGSYVTKHSEGTVRINVPNIYVMNQDGYEQEIEWALDKIKAFHGAQSFDPPALRGRKKKCLEVSETVND